MKEVISTLGAEAGATHTAIRKWRQRGEVPPRWQLPILKLAAAQGIEVEEVDFCTAQARKAKRSTRRQRAS